MNSPDRFKSESTTTVAFIGLGRMGAGMAECIQKGGFPLTVYNRTASKTEPFVARGATAAKTPREAATADIVLTSLLDDRSVLDMVSAEDGILKGLSPGSIHLSTTTISPAASARLSELHSAHGSHYVAVNVLGRPSNAAIGMLDALVAGEPEVIKRCRGVIEAFTNSMIVMGKQPELAARTKLIINFFLSGLLESMGETYVFAENYGIDPEIIRNLMLDQVFPNPALREYAERIRTHHYTEAGATLSTAVKDLNLILAEAATVNTPLPIADLVRNHIHTTLARGHGDLDWCVSTEANRIAAGLDLPGERQK